MKSGGLVNEPAAGHLCPGVNPVLRPSENLQLNEGHVLPVFVFTVQDAPKELHLVSSPSHRVVVLDHKHSPLAELLIDPLGLVGKGVERDCGREPASAAHDIEAGFPVKEIGEVFTSSGEFRQRRQKELSSKEKENGLLREITSHSAGIDSKRTVGSPSE